MPVQLPVYPDLPLRKLKTTTALPGGLLLIALAVSHAAQGAEPAPKQPISRQTTYQIRPQTLDRALVDFSLKSGLQVIADGKLTAGVKSPGVSGRYSPEQALQKLLAGTGVKVQSSRNGTVTLERAVVAQPQSSAATASETTLKPMTVSAEREYDDTDPFNPDYVQPDATTGTKTDTPIMETPLNVQVITKQVLRDQQVIRLDQALTNVSGVTLQTDSTNGSNLFLRGFQSQTIFRNGVRLDGNGFGFGQQFANVESIEVLKGPAAIVYGRVEPGGMVNIITKKPLATPYYSLNQQFGSYDLYRTSIDATGPLTKDDTLLYRMNMSYQNNGSFRDLVNNEDVFLAPVLKWNISPRTQATLEMEYQHENSNLDQQILPLVDAGTPSQSFENIPPNRNLGERNPVQNDTYFVGFNWSHQFNDDWALKHQVAFRRQDTTSGIFAIPADVRLADREVDRFAARFNGVTRDTITTILDLTGHFNTWGLKHNLLFGGDYYHFKDYTDLVFGSITSINIDNPVHPGVAELDPTSRSLSNFNTDNYGLYLQDQIELPYHVHVMGGLRYQYIHLTSKSAGFDGVFTSGDPQTNDAVTPRVGLLWQPKNWLSLYSNYAENFGANAGALSFGGIDSSGNALSPIPLGPTSAQQWEVGAKTEFFGGHLRATLAYFDLTKQNVATTDTSHPIECGGGACSIAVGEVRSRGPELDIQGEILPGLNVIATYTNQDVRVTKSNNGDVGNRLNFVPRNVGSVWTTYEVQQGPLDGFKIGGGVKVQDGVVDAGNTIKSPGYALLNLMTGYSFEAGKSRITAQLNIDNLLDKNYFTNASSAGNFGFVTFSTPRTFMGSINIQY